MAKNAETLKLRAVTNKAPEALQALRLCGRPCQIQGNHAKGIENMLKGHADYANGMETMSKAWGP